MLACIPSRPGPRLPRNERERMTSEESTPDRAKCAVRISSTLRPPCWQHSSSISCFLIAISATLDRLDPCARRHHWLTSQLATVSTHGRRPVHITTAQCHCPNRPISHLSKPCAARDDRGGGFGCQQTSLLTSHHGAGLYGLTREEALVSGSRPTIASRRSVSEIRRCCDALRN